MLACNKYFKQPFFNLIFFSTEKGDETLKGQKSISMEKSSAATIIEINKLTEILDDVSNMAITNNDEAPIEMVEEHSSNFEESDASNVESVIPILPAEHKCFGNSPTIFEFAKDVVIQNVNKQTIKKVMSKTWKIRCIDCTNKYTVNVSFTFCFWVFYTILWF